MICKYNINDLNKRIEDCAYGEQHKSEFANNLNQENTKNTFDNNTFNKNIYVGNLGSKVNTDMPEYVPVVTDNNELFFTSRRKDFEKEKKRE